MTEEDETILRQALRAERTTNAELQAIARVRGGIEERSFLDKGRGQGVRAALLASGFTAAVVAVSVATLVAHLSREQHAVPPPSGGPVASTTSPSPRSTMGAYPATFVAATAGGLDLIDSTSGTVLRTLTTTPPGENAADQFPTVTADGASAYFTRSVGSCGSTGYGEAILSVSTAGGPTSEVESTPPQAADLAPSVSADGRMLAWLRASCKKQGEAIYVRDLRTGAQRAIPIAPEAEVTAVAWGSDDQHLVVVSVTSSSPAVTVLITATATSSSDGKVLDASLCPTPFLRVLSNGTFVALACPSTPSASPSMAVFDATSGREIRVLQPVQISDTFLMSFSFSPDGLSAVGTELSPSPHPDVLRWTGGRAALVPFSAEEVAW